jgi:hypothetical protein
MQTFSQTVENVVRSVRKQAARASAREGHISRALIVRHVRAELARDGTPNAALKLVIPVAEAVRERIAELPIGSLHAATEPQGGPRIVHVPDSALEAPISEALRYCLPKPR